MSAVNTSDFRIEFDGVAIDNEQDNEITIETEFRETTSKGGGGGRTYLPSGKYNVSGSFSALFDHGATEGFSEALASLKNGTLVSVVYTDGVSTNKEYTISAYVGNVTLTSSGTGDNVSFSCSIQGTGEITESVIA